MFEYDQKYGFGLLQDVSEEENSQQTKKRRFESIKTQDSAKQSIIKKQKTKPEIEIKNLVNSSTGERIQISVLKNSSMQSSNRDKISIENLLCN